MSYLMLCSHCYDFGYDYSFTLFLNILLICILYANYASIVLSDLSIDKDIVKISSIQLCKVLRFILGLCREPCLSNFSTIFQKGTDGINADSTPRNGNLIVIPVMHVHVSRRKNYRRSSFQ